MQHHAREKARARKACKLQLQIAGRFQLRCQEKDAPYEAMHDVMDGCR